MSGWSSGRSVVVALAVAAVLAAHSPAAQEADGCAALEEAAARHVRQTAGAAAQGRDVSRVAALMVDAWAAVAEAPGPDRRLFERVAEAAFGHMQQAAALAGAVRRSERDAVALAALVARECGPGGAR